MSTLKTLTLLQVGKEFGEHVVRHLLQDCGLALGEKAGKIFVLVGIRTPRGVDEVLSIEVPPHVQTLIDMKEAPCGLAAFRTLMTNNAVPDHDYLEIVVRVLNEQEIADEKERVKIEAAIKVVGDAVPGLEAVMRRLLETVGEDLTSHEIQISGGKTAVGYDILIQAINVEHLGQIWAQSAGETNKENPNWLKKKFDRRQ